MPGGAELAQGRLKGMHTQIRFPGAVDLSRVDHNNLVVLQFAQDFLRAITQVAQADVQGRTPAGAHAHGAATSLRILHRELTRAESLKIPHHGQPLALCHRGQRVHPHRRDGG